MMSPSSWKGAYAGLFAAATLSLLLSACSEDTGLGRLVVDFIVPDTGPPARGFLRVNETKTVGATLVTLFPSGGSQIPEVIVTSSDPGIATVGEVGFLLVDSSVISLTQRTTFDVTGVSPGVVTITARTRAQSGLQMNPAQAIFLVFQTPYDVAITPAQISFMLGSRGRLVCAVTDGGVPVTDVQIDWSSSNPNIVAVEPDGTVISRAVGSADITCSVRAASGSATARVTVQPLTGPAPPGAITGAYEMSGPRLVDTCPAGTFSAALSGIAEVGLETGDLGFTIYFNAETSAKGTYNEVTGQWTGTGEAVRSFGGTPAVLSQKITGRWDAGPPVTFRGVNAFEFLSADRTQKLCEASFDATFAKLN